MTAEQFTYWLQGFMELTSMNHLSTTQFQIVKDHLALVFEKKTPNRTLDGLGNGNTKPYPNSPHIQQPTQPLPYQNPTPYTNPIPNNPNTIICSTSNEPNPTTPSDKPKFIPYSEGWLESLGKTNPPTRNDDEMLLC